MGAQTNMRRQHLSITQIVANYYYIDIYQSNTNNTCSSWGQYIVDDHEMLFIYLGWLDSRYILVANKEIAGNDQVNTPVCSPHLTLDKRIVVYLCSLVMTHLQM